MEVRLLGPLEVIADDGSSVPLGGPKEQVVLAVLAIHANRAVGEARLIDALWGEDVPRTATKTLQSYVSRLRRAVGGSATVEPAGDGYVLRVEPGALDVARVEQLLAGALEARQRGDPAVAVKMLTEAEGRWRGRSLGVLAEMPFALGEAARLDDLRLVIIEERLAAELDCGRHDAVVGELEARCAEHPLRERLWSLRMLGLYRAGRQGDALRAYQELRAHLADELGIDPSPDVRALESAILEQRPDLAWQPRGPSVAAHERAEATAVDALPEGTVTFLLTDIEGSTRLWERHPQEMAAALHLHDALVREVVESRAGRVVKSKGEGDAVFAVFADAAAGVHAALDVQRRLAAEPWPTPSPIRVRAAVHTGAAELRDGDYFGSVVNRAARLRAAGHGGQVLLSLATAELVRDQLPDGAVLRDLGVRRLKDLARPERVFQLEHPSLPADFPPLVTLDARQHNLPVQPTPLVGRGSELAELRDLVLRDGVRLVTVTGTGGVGKTRVALQVAAEVVDSFDDGVWFVPLAPLDDPALVPAAVARALGVREEPGADVADLVIGHLQSRHALLVLDNVEHVIDAAGFVADLLAGAARVTILASSREALRLRAERQVPVRPLGDDDAIALFTERAAASNPDFAASDADVAAIAEICGKLDRLPLAIELAAARASDYPPTELRRRMERRLDTLGEGYRDLPARQRTLRSAIGWSYELLSDDERAVLRRLAVFAGGGEMAAVREVCTGLNAAAAVPALSAKNLVRVDRGDGSERVSMLETIREFAGDALEGAGEAAAADTAHAQHFRAIVERAQPELVGADQARWLDLLDLEHDNFRHALASPHVDDDVAAALTAGLIRFWAVRGYFAEGSAWLDRALMRGGADTAERGAVLAGLGYFAELRGDLDEAHDQMVASLELRRRIRDEGGVAQCLQRLGTIFYQRGDPSTARAHYDEALQIRRRLGDRRSEARVLVDLGALHQNTGDPAGAAAHLAAALPILDELGDRRELSTALLNLGVARQSVGDTAAARDALERAVGLARELHDPEAEAGALVRLGVLLMRAGEHARARASLDHALALAERLGHRRLELLANDGLAALSALADDHEGTMLRRGRQLELALALSDQYQVAVSLTVLAVTAHEMGDAATAEAYRRQLIERSVPRGAERPLLMLLTSSAEVHDRAGVAACLAALAETALQSGRPSRAACLAAASTTIGDAGAAAAVAAAAREQLDEQELADAVRSGERMTLDEAVAYAQG